ncbi:hypothetical protein KY290_024315 [Solanum tuberosum]|uniref:Uncharacterized protein n=1 Tax=Solanum tuberosum TaxID=4113 RepID=A0ABQ7UTH2_SOLTU|nr:hypothetical protein KY290_024315 [Solanum tuberosum]
MIMTYSHKILEVSCFLLERLQFNNIQPPGAYMSGLREASHISQSMKARQRSKENCIKECWTKQ